MVDQFVDLVLSIQFYLLGFDRFLSDLYDIGCHLSIITVSIIANLSVKIKP